MLFDEGSRSSARANAAIDTAIRGTQSALTERAAAKRQVRRRAYLKAMDCTLENRLPTCYTNWFS